MKYKEFKNWCDNRCFDGCWSMNVAMFCIDVMRKINREPFWKREKIWRKQYENTIVYGVINPINKKISEMEENNVFNL